MTPRRGDGIGIEITERGVHGVRLQHHCAGRVACTAEVGIDTGGTSHQRLLAALVEIARSLGEIERLPSRIAWFPHPATLRASDGIDLASLDAELVLSAGGVPWTLAMRWPLDETRSLVELARRAGFHEPLVEPSPVSLGRVGPADAYVAERLTAGGDGWSAVFSGGVPLLAAGRTPVLARLAANTSPADDLVMWAIDEPAPTSALDTLLGETCLMAAIGSAADRVRGEALPFTGPVPAARMTVALGAAMAAARLAGRNRVVATRSTAAAVDDSFEPALPWAVERLADTPATERSTTWWEAGRARVRRWWSAVSDAVRGRRRGVEQNTEVAAS